jgi:diacylglycerol kinase (ATP)
VSGRPRAHGFAGSLSCAFRGLTEAAVAERNLRLHFVAAVLVSCFAAIAPLTPEGRALLLLCGALVISAEAANSALETVVDLASPSWHERARVAKDSAAAAVLALAMGSVVVFLTIAWPVLSLQELVARRNEVGAALGAAAVAGLLPAPSDRSHLADLALVAGALLCLSIVARAALSPGPVVAAAVVLAVACESARRTRWVGTKAALRA